MIRYHSASEADEAAEPPPSEKRPAARVLSALTWVVLSLVLAVWAAVGAVFWIPLLIRAMLRFSLNLVGAVLEGQKPVMSARQLKDALSFYRRGFVVAVEVVMGEETEVERAESGEVTSGTRLLLEALWAVLVWYLILLWAGGIEASPMDLWGWFSSIPWREHFGDLVQRFKV